MAVIYRWIVYQFTSIAWPTSRRWRCPMDISMCGYEIKAVLWIYLWILCWRTC